MITTLYDEHGIVEQKFLAAHEGEILTALYLDGSKGKVRVLDGKCYKLNLRKVV